MLLVPDVLMLLDAIDKSVSTLLSCVLPFVCALRYVYNETNSVVL